MDVGFRVVGLADTPEVKVGLRVVGLRVEGLRVEGFAVPANVVGRADVGGADVGLLEGVDLVHWKVRPLNADHACTAA